MGKWRRHKQRTKPPKAGRKVQCIFSDKKVELAEDETVIEESNSNSKTEASK
jgi:tRNA A37 threonylcarbamoyladenosine dehydratase